MDISLPSFAYCTTGCYQGYEIIKISYPKQTDPPELPRADFCCKNLSFFVFMCYNERKAKQQPLIEVENVNSHKKKMIAPIIITVIMVVYYVVYFCFLISLLDGGWKYALGILPILLSAVMVYVCVERINEIRKGEEDDLSKY